MLHMELVQRLGPQKVSSFTNNALKVGVDWSSYPSSRAYVCGITMTF